MVFVVDRGVPLVERWAVVAFARGRVRLLSPLPFPICGSRHEAADRVKLKLGMDPDFRAKWAGWKFSQMPLDTVVENGNQRPHVPPPRGIR